MDDTGKRVSKAEASAVDAEKKAVAETPRRKAESAKLERGTEGGGEAEEEKAAGAAAAAVPNSLEAFGALMKPLATLRGLSGRIWSARGAVWNPAGALLELGGWRSLLAFGCSGCGPFVVGHAHVCQLERSAQILCVGKCPGTSLLNRQWLFPCR